MARIKHWYDRRKHCEDMSVHDQAVDKEGAWMMGYHAAVQAYVDELAEALRKEGYRVEERFR